MRKILLLIAIAFALTSSAQFIEEEPSGNRRQKNNEPKFTDNLFFGGNLGLVFGSYTAVNISPIVGYRFKPELSLGVGAIYEYYSDKRIKGYEFTTTIYGGKFFAQSVLFEKVILYFENNVLSLEKKYFDYDNQYPDDGRFIVNVPWIGGGLYQDFGKGGVFLMILFNLNKNRNAPYPDYEFRIGVNF